MSPPVSAARSAMSSLASAVLGGAGGLAGLLRRDRRAGRGGRDLDDGARARADADSSLRASRMYVLVQVAPSGGRGGARVQRTP